MEFELNRPEVVAEVSALFERYEQALIERDVAVLDATFWQSPHTVRLAVRENGWGWEAIHAHRVGAVASGSMSLPGGSKEVRMRLEILTVGRDLATVNYMYKQRGVGQVGRQSQTWVRFPEVGWKVVAAHVSVMPPGTEPLP